MTCKWPGCSAESFVPLRGRPAKFCLEHKWSARPPAPLRTTCSACGGPLDRPRNGHGRASLCFPCRDKRKAERNYANVVRWQKANPNKVRAQHRRAYLKKRPGPLPPLSCVECFLPTNRGPMALRCRPCLRRHMKLRSNYGIGISDYNALLAAQDGRCAVCRGEPDGHGDLHVDHDHATGRVRGLLCASCNLGLGQLGDSLERLQACVAYLSR